MLAVAAGEPPLSSTSTSEQVDGPTIDVEAAITQIVAQSDYPNRQEWAKECLGATSSDTGALTTFRALRDGRLSS